MEITISPQKSPPPRTPSEPPAAPATPPIPPTPEELRANAVDTAIAMWGDAKPVVIAPVEPAAPAPALVPAPAPAAEPAPAPPVAPPAEPPVRQPDAITMDEPPMRRPKAPVFQAQAAPFELSPEDQRDYPVICFMAFKEAKHAQLPQQFLEWAKKHYEYVAKWEAEHEGEDFNADDKEHRAFYATQPEISREQIDAFRVKMEVAEAMRPAIEEKEKEDEEKAEVAAFHRALPKMVQNVSRQVVTMVDEVDANLGKLLRDDKGAYRIDEQAEAAVEAADPIAKPILKEIQMKELVPLIGELEKLAIPGTKYRLEPDRNPLHERIARYQIEAERAILAGPEEDRTFEGRKFLSHAELAGKKNEIRRSNASTAEKEAKLDQLDREFYTLTVDDLQEIIRDDLVAKAKRQIAQANAAAERKYGHRAQNEPPVDPTTVQPPAAAPAVVAPAAPTPAPANPGGKPKPPSLSSGADVMPNPSSVGAGGKKASEVATDVMFK